MTLQCPYRHISYASWRLKAFRHLLSETPSRSFTTTSSLQFPPPNPNQKKRRGNNPKRQREKELERIGGLLSEISGLFGNTKTPPSAEPDTSTLVKQDEQEAARESPEPQSKPPPHPEQNDTPVKISRPQSAEELHSDISTLLEQLGTSVPSESDVSAPAQDGEAAQKTPPSHLESVLHLQLSDMLRKRYQSESQSQSQPRLSDSLPKSPIVSRLEQRSLRKKARGTKDELERLKHNPWAQALASPIRMCSATGARIPRLLLHQWGLVQHPTTGALWLMPVNLVQQELQKAAAKIIPPTKDDGDDALPIPARSSFPGLCIANSIGLLERMNAVKQKLLTARLIPAEWKAPAGPIPQKAALVWRQDMPGFVLRHMRDMAVAEVKKIKELEPAGRAEGDWTVLEMESVNGNALRESLAAVKDLENANCGVVIVLRRDEPTSAPETDPETTESSNRPPAESSSQSPSHLPQLPEYLDLPQGSKVPVYDLTRLLTREQIEALREHGEIFNKPALFCRPGTRAPNPLIFTLFNLHSFMQEQ
ncbi:hypothetical protein FQN50_007750 [Emmonsiellopsis sp. PD_5]|nr:hypothetical protein FQN50_007750 [Emmonsiellopsis sp. PD_5]